MPLINFKKIIDSVGGGILQGAADIISKVKADPTKILEIESELEKLKAIHIENMSKIEVDLEQAYIKDVQDSRQMQGEALNQQDLFSKRFIYYLAIIVIVIVSIFDFIMFYVNYPPENRDMINMIAGILNSTALVMVLQFFFGSSSGSKSGSERIDKMMDTLIKK